jgi:hypothetical protein
MTALPGISRILPFTLMIPLSIIISILGSISRKGGKGMKGFKALLVLCGMALAACAVPLGEDYLITRDGTGPVYITDYNLQNYVPIPKTGERPITMVSNRQDLDMIVVWKDSAGAAIAFDEFLPDTMYQADIRITARAGYGFYPATPFGYPDGKTDSQYDDLGDPARIVTVAYNNSDDADITFVTDYDLQRYVPIPLAGEKPVRSVTGRLDLTIDAEWEVEDPADSGGFAPISAGEGYTFELGKVYRAAIRLRANSGYRFSAAKDFEYPPGAVQVQPNRDRDPADRGLTAITYQAAQAGRVISDFNLTRYIPRPVSGAAALTAFTGIQYTGTVIWKNTGTRAVLAGPFQSDTRYTAEVSLHPAMGYTLAGLGQDTFIHTGAESVGNTPDSGTITIGFAATGGPAGPQVVYDTILTGRISRPINGVTPVAVIAGSQYTGTVRWTPAHSAFQLDVPYTAALTLNAAPGFTFTGIGADAFIHADGTASNAADSNTVTISFPPAASSANPAISFGPAETEGSALWLMKDKRDYIYTLYIDLPEGTEPITRGAVLVAGDTSPANVVIDGHHRVLRIRDPGVLLTVSGDVTLTLKNITIEGNDGNSTPLFKVWPGGKLILGEGVTLIGNESAGDVGGVWVNGGTLMMNDGAAIKGMKGRRAGGVLVDAKGRFFMRGGAVGGPAPADGNTASAEYGGGGVLVVQGTLDMDGSALIQGNRSEAPSSGGGVGILAKGTFNQYRGTIQENTALGENSGGGVYNTGKFTMNTVGVVIKKNTVNRAYSGGGVYIDGVDGGSFTMNNGTIEENTALGNNSGGGVFTQLTYNYSLACVMSSGTIQKNEALGDNSGGGICLVDNGGFEVFAGSVAENTAWGESSGGGVYATNGTFSMTSVAAVIKENIAKEANSGGGVYSVNNRGINIGNGTVKNNRAMAQQSGGGLYIASNGGGSLGSGGAIKGNRAEWNGPGTAYADGSGGGVYMAGGEFSNRGTIGGDDPLTDANIAVIGANGVYVAAGSFRNSGKITGNIAISTDNYGVYIKNTAIETFVMDSVEAVVTEDNMVFLCPDATISIGRVDSLPYPAANIICDVPPVSYQVDTTLATKLLSCSGVSSNRSHLNATNLLFYYNDAPVNITDSVGSWPAFYGYYNEPPP